jgi:branched-chain amino acid transport system permease protein
VEHSGKALIASGVIVLCLFLFPVIGGTAHTLNLAVMLYITFILAQSWNILGGYAGQVSLGNSAFYGIGGLVFVILSWRWGLALYVALPAAGVAGVALASLIGIPALRLKGAYFAIGTLALAEALRITIGNIYPVTIYMPTTQINNFSLPTIYYLSLSVAVLTQAVAYLMIKRKIGLAMMAIRDDYEAAENSGVHLFKYKFMALMFSSFFSGLAGGIFAYYQTSFMPAFLFSPQWTFEPLVAACIGGSGTLLGPVLGTVFLIILTELFALTLGKAYLIVFGAMFIFVVLFLPGGLIEAFSRLRGALQVRSKTPAA